MKIRFNYLNPQAWVYAIAALVEQILQNASDTTSELCTLFYSYMIYIDRGIRCGVVFWWLSRPICTSQSECNVPHRLCQIPEMDGDVIKHTQASSCYKYIKYFTPEKKNLSHQHLSP